MISCSGSEKGGGQDGGDEGVSSSGGDIDKEVLDDGDAEWERPPFDPPGGDGEKPADTGGDEGYPGGTGAGTTTGDGGTTDWTGTSTDWTGTSTGTTTGGFVCESGETDTGGVCDVQPGACEATPPVEPDTGGTTTGGEEPTPCCQDQDCACDTGFCGNAPCQADGYCDCNCPADPDCGQDQCGGKQVPNPLTTPGDPAAACPASADPVVLYMSNDDSNSQASPTYARRAIQEGQIVDPFRIRIHEFLNYYDLSYEAPVDAPAQVGMQMRRINADTGEFALLLYAQARKLVAAERRPLNLVFSLDSSGSMDGEPFELLKASMTAAAGQLIEGDIVSIVSWNDIQSIELAGHVVSGPDDPELLSTIAGLVAGGSTDLHAGLVTAYDLAQQSYDPGRINRVVIISDGGANTGITDQQIIAEAARDEDGEGIYLVGVGVGSSWGYNDTLMDTVTDWGKGAYLFIDSQAEAQRAFGTRFLQNMEVAARDVQMQLTLPWYFGVKEFHGEEYSKDPAEVEPQHLAPNDAMSYHQTVQSCDPRQIFTTDTITARATFEHPITRELMSSEVTLPIGQVVDAPADQLYKADVIVAYAQSLVVIGDLYNKGEAAAAGKVAGDMVAWLGKAEEALKDAEIAEMRALMQQYAALLP